MFQAETGTEAPDTQSLSSGFWKNPSHVPMSVFTLAHSIGLSLCKPEPPVIDLSSEPSSVLQNTASLPPRHSFQGAAFTQLSSSLGVISAPISISTGTQIMLGKQVANESMNTYNDQECLLCLYNHR